MKEIRLYYVQPGGQIGELITEDFGKNWEHGSLINKKFEIAIPGGLAAYPGDHWRVIIRMKGQLHTFVELYEASPKSWVDHPIP